MVAQHQQLTPAARPGPGADGSPRPEAREGGAVAAWLDVLCSMLRLPPPEKQSVRDELENHLRERVRDLMVTGVPEIEAAGRAVGELGDAANLAREFRAARRTPIRRTLMNFAFLGIAAGAMVTSLVALSGGIGPRSVAVSVFQPTPQPPAAPKATIHFGKVQDVPWSQFFEFLGDTAGMPVFVHWSSLRGINIDPPIEEEGTVRLRLSGDMALDRAIELINDDLGVNSENRLDYRVRDGRLVFAARSFFDHQETVLATYDLSDLINQRIVRGGDESTATEEVIGEVTRLITTLVHSEQWADNGGDSAAITHYGTKLFIKAPKRFHPEIQWILAEVGTGEIKVTPKQAKENAADVEVRSYPIKNIPAEEALRSLKTLKSIRKIDFTPFAFDAHNNSIIGRASPGEHAMIAGSLLEIDTSKQAVLLARRNELKAVSEDLRRRLADLSAKRQELEAGAAKADQQKGGPPAADVQALLNTLRDQEAQLKAELAKNEEAARQLR